MQKSEAFRILGLPEFATKEQVKKAYYSLCKQLHPDDNPLEEAKTQYLLVQQAYTYIMDNNFSVSDRVPHVYGQVTKTPKRTGKVVGGWQTTEPSYTERQYRQLQIRRMEEARKKKLKEEEERKQKIRQAIAKAHKLPSEREEEKWKKIEMQREAERIAELIRQIMSLEDITNEQS